MIFGHKQKESIVTVMEVGHTRLVSTRFEECQDKLEVFLSRQPKFLLEELAYFAIGAKHELVDLVDGTRPGWEEVYIFVVEVYLSFPLLPCNPSSLSHCQLGFNRRVTLCPT